MIKYILSSLLILVILFITQFFILDMINLGKITYYYSPMIYILYIIMLPKNINKNIVLIISFIMGFSVDLFYNSFGIHTTACLMLSFIRGFYIKNLDQHNMYEESIISISFRSIALNRYIVYILVMNFSFYLTYYQVDIMSYKPSIFIIFKSLTSSISNSLLIFIIEITFSNNKKNFLKE